MLTFHVVMFRNVTSERISYSGSFQFGATQSFVSPALNKRFNDALGEVEFPLKVEIANDQPVTISRVH